MVQKGNINAPKHEQNAQKTSSYQKSMFSTLHPVGTDSQHRQ